MTPKDFFLLTVQTLILRGGRISQGETASVLSEAWDVDAEALGERNPAECALEFFRWQTEAQGAMPKWLADYEEAKKHRVRISLNRGAEATQWWMSAEALAEGCPPACRPIVCDRIESLVVSASDAELFTSWGESIPGWHESPFLLAPADAHARE